MENLIKWKWVYGNVVSYWTMWLMRAILISMSLKFNTFSKPLKPSARIILTKIGSISLLLSTVHVFFCYIITIYVHNTNLNIFNVSYILVIHTKMTICFYEFIIKPFNLSREVQNDKRLQVELVNGAGCVTWNSIKCHHPTL